MSKLTNLEQAEIDTIDEYRKKLFESTPIGKNEFNRYYLEYSYSHYNKKLEDINRHIVYKVSIIKKDLIKSLELKCPDYKTYIEEYKDKIINKQEIPLGLGKIESNAVVFRFATTNASLVIPIIKILQEKYNL